MASTTNMQAMLIMRALTAAHVMWALGGPLGVFDVAGTQIFNSGGQSS